ncbi:MAG: hypothetical protein LAO08_04250 [Acidobacteriia bacterium]|nr:hypothetical protein [Terriglobia bacterium]
MATPSILFSRKDKCDDAETILYEIDLLRFTRGRLLSSNSAWTQRDEWVYLESFLLHFRNLIEFFGKPKPDKDDLTVQRPKDFRTWKALTKPDIELMTRPDLWKKYETRQNPESISKYLHHCTKRRTIKKKWDVEAMFSELRPAIDKFESLLPEYKPVTGLTQTRGVSFLDGNSTASTRVWDSSLVPEK